MKSSVLAALLGYSTVQAAERTKSTYASTLGCGDCIYSGFVFCFQGLDGAVVASGSAEPTKKCCQDATCAEASDTSYSCSNTFADSTYSKSMCPQMQSKCGNKQSVTLATEGTSETVSTTGMVKGDSCTYRLKANCGAPTMRLKSESTVSADNVQITYVEYENAKASITDGSVQTTAISDRKKKAPADGMPARDQSFSSSGNQSQYGGQKQPGMTQKGTGKKSDSTAVGQKSKPAEFNIETMFMSADQVKTEATVGYGVPTSGTYSASTKGYKTMGTEGQGNTALGLRADGTSACQDRGMVVTIDAAADQGGATVLLELSSSPFDTSNTGAIALMASAVSALAVASSLY